MPHDVLTMLAASAAGLLLFAGYAAVFHWWWYKTAFIERLLRLRRMVADIMSQEFDDHCWRDWHGNYKALAELAGVEFRPKILPREAMMANCGHFVQCLIEGGAYQAPYVAVPERQELYDALMAVAAAASDKAAFMAEAGGDLAVSIHRVEAFAVSLLAARLPEWRDERAERRAWRAAETNNDAQSIVGGPHDV